jgi:hypothetical protein
MKGISIAANYSGILFDLLAALYRLKRHLLVRI